MNKKLKVMGASLAILALTATGASARQIRGLNHFSLPAWKAVVKTDYCVKAITNANWVLNVSNLTCDSVDTYLANGNGARRSSYVTVGEGRHEISSTGVAGYQYRAVLMNSTSTFFDHYIDGTWSPDNR